MSREPMASWESVSKKYRGVPALTEFSLALGPGVHCLLGPNGAGKSTALGILTGVRAASRGTVQVLGKTVVRGGPQTRWLGSVPQSLSFPATLTAREVLGFVAMHYPDPVPLGRIVTELGLQAFLEKHCGGLSGGQRRRLGIACAVIANAPVLILDEPLAGLDIEGRAAVRHLILAQRSAGRCIIMASHDYAEVESTADTVTLVKDGIRLASGSTDSVRGTLALSHVVFNAPEAPAGVTPLGALQRLDDGRFRLTTRHPDQAARILLQALDRPRLQINPSSLEEAVGELLLEPQR
ncbi:MAG: ABC transporter ATP-binding protein [Renibacterium sp.]|nr:ABC transporter ATP-binding protein [Renibacterium sp.]